ncbi:hypothetical protein [Streptomyces sp. SD15]
MNKKNYRWVKDPSGFSLYVPRSFKRDVNAENAVYVGESKSQEIEIKATVGEGRTPWKEIQATEREVSSDPGYKRIRLDVINDTPDSPAELEYYSGEPSDGALRTVVFSSLGPDGRIYSVLVTGPAESWRDSHAHFRMAVGSLCVTGYTCTRD